MKKIPFVLIIFASGMLLAYQNCGKPMSFSSQSSLVGNGTPDVPTPDDPIAEEPAPEEPTPDDIPETPIGEDDGDIIADCKTASLLTKEQNIFFKNNRDNQAPRIVNDVGGRCDWGMNG